MQNIVDVLKEKYEYELERKRYYDDVISLPVSLIAFIVTGTYFIVAENSLPSWLCTIRPILVLLSTISTIVTMYFLSRVYFGLKRFYCSFPSSSDVLSDYGKIKELHSDEADEEKRKILIENEFTNCIIKWYTDANDENLAVNDLRAEAFHRAKLAILISYISSIIMFILYCIAKLT
ncbi:hypothetical protein [Mucilaginibacter psychrotolerans]|uniref:Uncharacterized protein n=1 Tax=Mucilaginibacter psychrotolerans TaxID=1524096 RepID=A0A4Y8S7N0_9SPHI|nr:hypothetical protein [Mucilaginibacter psychrotolerans]TFF34394.1 hypothetical protein E2R66_22225 [Mucilaginibacter psychrotolerans]